MFFIKLLSTLPLAVLYLFSDILYFFMLHVLRYRKKVVVQNLKKSFPDKSDEEISKITKAFYKNLADLTVETLKMPSIKKDEIVKRVKFKNIDLPNSYLNKGSSILVLTGHQCNWEWLLLACSIHSEYPIDGVYKPMHIESLDKLFLDMRSRFGANPLPMKDVFRSVIRNKNEVRVLALVADQTPPHGEIQHFTDFLSQNTPFFVGADKIAQHTQYPVLFVEMIRLKRGYYEAEFHVVKEAPYKKGAFEIIEAYAKLLEKSINKHPSDWLWSHKRWKYRDFKTRKNLRDDLTV